MSSSSVYRMDALTRDNYDTWKLQMEALLIKNDSFGYVNGSISKPVFNPDDQTSKDAVDSWMKADAKARSDLILAISPSELKQIKSCTTSRAVWLKLEDIFQSKGPARKATLLKQLTLQKMLEGGDVREHINRFFDAVDKLNDMGVKVNPDLLAIMLLYSLPNSFDNFRCAIESRDELPSPDILRVKILEESEACTQTKSAEGDALLIKKNWSRGGFSDGSKPKWNSKSNLKCFKCKRRGHKASECELKKEQSVGIASDMCLTSLVSNDISTVNFPSKNLKWCLDSGATSHIIKDCKDFGLISRSNRGKLNLANGACTDICGRGSGKLIADLGVGKVVNITLKNSLHVPESKLNLLSVGKITDNNCCVIFQKNSAVVKRNSDGEEILKADRVGDLYFVRESTATECINTFATKPAMLSAEENAKMWHCRMGHLNFSDLRKAHRDGVLSGMSLKKFTDPINCDICCQGKMIRAQFPKESNRDTELLELIHTDVCGPMRTESVGKAKYFVEFIDDYTRWCEVRFLRSKSEVPEVTKEVIAYFERQKQKQVRCLQSDNGTEYLNEELDKFLKKRELLGD